MSSIYKTSKNSLYYVSVRHGLRDGKDLWFVEYHARQGDEKLFFKDINSIISHMYFYWGLSKMKNRNYEEIYELVKTTFDLHSGEDILGLQK